MKEAGESQFLSHRIAANDMPGFKNQARVACFPQVGCRNQAVMASASYDKVELFCHRCFLLRIWYLK
jgi:hypothetical protein